MENGKNELYASLCIMKCETKSVNLNELYIDVSKGNIIKPQIQRSICWDIKPPANGKKCTNVYDFIHFLISTRNAVNPLIIVKTIHKNSQKFVLIDGNNRMNAIINFMNAPLKLFTDLLDSKLFSQESLEVLMSVNLTDIVQNSITSLFESKDKKALIKKDFEKHSKMKINENYKSMQTYLRDVNFGAIMVPITEFSDVNESEMVELYEGLNKSGVALNEQDVLASTTSFFTYNPSNL